MQSDPSEIVRLVTTKSRLCVADAEFPLEYDNLLRGSRNQLRSSMKLLTQTRGRLHPPSLSQVHFDAIVHLPMESGR
jgi:hypothetical protein